jgi:hypothetical protein
MENGRVPARAFAFLGSVGKIDAQKLRTGRLDPQDWDRLGIALGKLNEAPILIDETPSLNPLWRCAPRARRKARSTAGSGSSSSTTSSSCRAPIRGRKTGRRRSARSRGASSPWRRS